ncbi:MAG: hypothetical protein AAF772_12140, partial [Acidobacteriota bacterium]
APAPDADAFARLPPLDGRSLWPFARGAAPDAVIASAHLDVDRYRLRSLRDGDWKLLEAEADLLGAPRIRLFDLARDPGEHSDLAAARAVRAQALAQHLAALAQRRRAAAAAEVTLDEETEAGLRALGYL